MQEYKLYIDGKFCDAEGGKTADSINPATEQPWARIARASRGDTQRAIQAARTAFDIVLRSKSSFGVRLNAVLELMDIESATGNRVAFERRRAEGEASRPRMPPSMLADFYYKSGVGLARFGQIARARDLLLAGQEHSETYRLNTWYFRFEHTVANLSGCEIREPDPALTEAREQPPAIREVAIGLRDFALQAT